MKYSLKCLEHAITIILPDSPKWPSSINRPTRINMAANQLFMNPEKFEDVDSKSAIVVIRTAMLELSTIGWITPGDVNLHISSDVV